MNMSVTVKPMCKFCRAMEENKLIGRIKKEQFPDMSYRYSVAIVRRTFVKGRSGREGRMMDLNHRGVGYMLNYCPECGKKMQ